MGGRRNVKVWQSEQQSVGESRGEGKLVGKERNEKRQEEKHYSLGHLCLFWAQSHSLKTQTLPQSASPAFHHHDFQMNCNLICNTIILAYIAGYVTPGAKSWPQSAKQLLLWSNLHISTQVCVEWQQRRKSQTWPCLKSVLDDVDTSFLWIWSIHQCHSLL